MIIFGILLFSGYCAKIKRYEDLDSANIDEFDEFAREKLWEFKIPKNLHIRNSSRCDIELKYLRGSDFWYEHILLFSNRYFLISPKESFVFLKVLLSVLGEWRRVAENCMQGFLIILINSLDAVEVHLRDDKLVRKLYIQTAHLLGESDLVGFHWYKSLREDPKWESDWDRTKLALDDSDSLFWVKPFVFDYGFLLNLYLPSDPDFCKKRGLKVFVYESIDTPLLPGSLVCGKNSQWAFETIWHKFFLQSQCRVHDPETADLFYVPMYPMCYRALAEVHEPFDELLDDVLTQLSFFDKRKGTDHIFVFVDNADIFFPSWREKISRSIIMTPDAVRQGKAWKYPIIDAKQTEPMFDPFRDIAIPSFTDSFRLFNLQRFNRDISQRIYLACFIGRHAGNHALYKDIKVRSDIFVMQDWPGLVIQEEVDDAFDIKGNSLFCFIPHGTSVWTNHLYEAILSGCIPVVLSDDWILPFSDVVHWGNFSIFWSQANVGVELYEYLDSLRSERWKLLDDMKQSADRAACWFNYHSSNDQCSPYTAVVHKLADKVRFI